MIEYLKGDAVYPIETDKNKINLILQINNDIGAYGAGFSGALAKRWPIVEIAYRDWYNGKLDSSLLSLGEIQIVNVDGNIDYSVNVVNMIAQHNIGLDKNKRSPIRYDALDQCLFKLNKWIIKMKLNKNEVLIHLPRIGAGLAGGKWSVIEALLNENLGQYQMYIYDL